MKRGLFIIFFAAVFSVAFSQEEVDEEVVKDKKESVHVFQRITDNKSLYADFFSLSFDNPAMRYKKYDHSLTDVAAGGQFRDESEAVIMQRGEGYNLGFVDVKSFVVLENSSMWGGASYKNGKEKNWKWNETSDFLLLYPYVMGDSVGGDFKKEEYYFNGGYTGKAGRFLWGVDGSYRATLGYRQVDPRPRNVTGELDFTLGAAMCDLLNYRIGVFVNANKYKQKNTIKFYNEQGHPSVYHFVGLGMDYYRFRGEKVATYYKGHRFGGGLNLMPEKKDGFNASVSFEYFSFEKIISTLNELPMAEANDYIWKAEAGYRKDLGYRSWGTKVEFCNNHRKGIENIFGDPANDIYPLISSAQQYSNKQTDVKVIAFYEDATPARIGWSAMPMLGYYSTRIKYIYPSRSLENDRLNAGVALRAWKQMGMFMLSLNGAVRHSASLSSELELTGIKEENTLEPLYSNYRFVDSGNTVMDLGLKGYFSIKKRYAPYLSVNWEHGWFAENVNTNMFTATLGLEF